MCREMDLKKRTKHLEKEVLILKDNDSKSQLKLTALKAKVKVLKHKLKATMKTQQEILDALKEAGLRLGQRHSASSEIENIPEDEFEYKYEEDFDILDEDVSTAVYPCELDEHTETSTAKTSQLDQHIDASTVQASQLNGHIDTSTAQTSQLDEHISISTVSSEPKFRCFKCDLPFEDAQEFCKHAKEHVTFRCKVCDKTFERFTSLKNHEKYHESSLSVPSSQAKFRCLKCDISFEDKQKFYKHAKEHGTTFQCKLCDKAFDHLASLKRHEKIHAPKIASTSGNSVQSNICVICSKKFENIRELQVHVLNHLSSQIFECLTCKKKFDREDTLISHCIYFDHVSSRM